MGEKGVCPAKGSRVGHRSCKGRPRQFTDKVPPFVLEKSSEGSIKRSDKSCVCLSTRPWDATVISSVASLAGGQM